MTLHNAYDRRFIIIINESSKKIIKNLINTGYPRLMRLRRMQNRYNAIQNFFLNKLSRCLSGLD